MEHETSPEDELKAENELLRLKLEMEHGMADTRSDKLSPEAENQWLNHIYNFEKAFKDAKRVRLYEFLGSPSFKKSDNLTADELKIELDRIVDVMGENGVGIDFICDYSEELMYKFITEELFEHEMDDMRVEGMMTGFIYEEFHPNHDYDLRKDSVYFLEDILKRRWNEDFNNHKLHTTVLFKGKEYDRHGIAEIIFAFQDAHKKFKMGKTNIKEVIFSLEEGKASVKMILSYTAQTLDGVNQKYSGECLIQFKRDNDYWYVNSFSLPGFGD